jgi:hypothetical protein
VSVNRELNARTPLTEEEARHLLLVRAVEMQDTAETLLTAEDRRQATAAGLHAAARRHRRGRGGDDEASWWNGLRCFRQDRDALAGARPS